MINWLCKEGNVFPEIVKKLPNFKSEINLLLNDINTTIHKSGMDTFYTYRLRKNKKYHKKKLKEFEEYLLKTIKIIAIMRLILDPFPLLLTDKEMYYRCPDVLCYPLSEDMLSLLGDEVISKLKQTNEYVQYYNYFIDFEKRNEAMNNYFMSDCINLDEFDQVLLQKHLLDPIRQKFLDMISCSNKIIKLQTDDGVYETYRGLV